MKKINKNFSSIAYILCLLIVACLIAVVWQGFRQQPIVIISTNGIDKIRLDSAQAVIKKKISEKSYYTYSDSVLDSQLKIIANEMDKEYWNVCIDDSLNWRTFLAENDISTNKDSQLSLWAAALAVIFVLFSVYGLIKVDTTLSELKKAKENSDNLLVKEKKLFNHQKKQIKELYEEYKTSLTIASQCIYSRTYEERESLFFKLLNNFNKIENLIHFHIVELYRLDVLKKEYNSQVDIKDEQILRYNCIISIAKRIYKLSNYRETDKVRLIHALSLFRKNQLVPQEDSQKEINVLFEEMRKIIKDKSTFGLGQEFDQEFNYCYNFFKADVAENDDNLIKIIDNIKQQLKKK